MNETVSDRAQTALTAPSFEILPHYCWRWCRQVVEADYGKLLKPYYRRSARLTALALIQSPYFVPLKRGHVIGDILFKTHGSGGDGHCGIRIPDNRVAENSSVHWDGNDARGIRTLREFGNFDVIVRLPPLAEFLASQRNRTKAPNIKGLL
jgi:hypothetical protein